MFLCLLSRKWVEIHSKRFWNDIHICLKVMKWWCCSLCKVCNKKTSIPLSGSGYSSFLFFDGNSCSFTNSIISSILQSKMEQSVSRECVLMPSLFLNRCNRDLLVTRLYWLIPFSLRVFQNRSYFIMFSAKSVWFATAFLLHYLNFKAIIVMTKWSIFRP